MKKGNKKLDKDKLTPQNLYDILDEQTEIQNEAEIKKSKRGIYFGNLIQYGISITKVILLLAFIGLIINFKHGNIEQITHDIKGYFYNFDNTQKMNNYPMKKITDEDGNITFIPDIKMTGTVRKDDEFYIVFKYNNKIHTLSQGDKFGDNYTVTKIYHNAMEMTDKNGEVYMYSLEEAK